MADKVKVEVVVEEEEDKSTSWTLALPPDKSQTTATSVPGTPSQHRSRKEKLVVRSFSTELEDSGIIVCHEVFDGSVGKRKGSPRVRRTASAPAPSTREQSDEEEEDVVEVEEREPPPGEQKGNKKVRKKRKTKILEDEDVEEQVPTKMKMTSQQGEKGRKKAQDKSAPQAGVKRKCEELSSSYSGHKRGRKSGQEGRMAPSTPPNVIRRYNSSQRQGQGPSPSGMKRNKVTFMDPMVGMMPRRGFPGRGGGPSIPAAAVSAPPPPPLQLQPMVRYRIPGIGPVFYHSTNKSRIPQPGKDTGAIPTTNMESDDTDGASKLLPPPPPPPPSNNLPRFTAPQPPADTGGSDPVLTITKEQQEARYARGIAALNRLMSEYVTTPTAEEPSKLSFSLPDLCRETIANLAKLVAKPPPFRVAKGPSAPADKDSSDSDSDADTQHHRRLGRDLLQGKTLELQDLLRDSAGDGSYNPRFLLGSYTAPDKDRTIPKGVGGLRMEELELFEELMTPDPEFELTEREQKSVDLYCALVASELKAVEAEAKRKARLEAVLNSAEPTRTESGRKIYDAYPILVKPEDAARFPPGILMKQEEFMKIIMNGKENLKELDTRQLRNGKQVPLKKLYLRNLIQKKREEEKERDGHSYQQKPASTAPSTAPPSTAPASTAPTSTIAPGRPIGVPRPKGTLYFSGPPGITRTMPPLDFNHIGTQSNTNLQSMSLRTGKEIRLLPSHPVVDAEMSLHLPPTLHGVGGKGQETPSSKSGDDYSSRVEDSLRGLETAATPIIGPPSVPSYGGGSLLDSILLPNQSCPTSGSSSRCQTIRPVGGRLYTNNLSNNNSQSLPSGQTMSWGGSGGDGFGFRARTPPPQMSSQFSLSPVHGENSCFKPIQSHPLSSGANAGNGSSQQYFNFNTSPSTRMSGFITPPPHSTTPTSSPGSASSSPLSKARYSRQKHTSLCPPFQNNHCSFATHHCSYSRAPNSRFCIHHVDEGTTVHFQRCKYVKGSRECGRFIPVSSSQALFCDIHALTIANAHIRKTKPEKSLDKTGGLLKHMRCNLDRTQGKIMESDGAGSFCVRKDFLEDERETLNNSSSSSDDSTDDEGGFGHTVRVADYYRAQKGDEDSDVDDWTGADGSVHGDCPDYAALKTAGFYTVEEVVKLSKTALLQQQQLLNQSMDVLKRQYARGWKEYKDGIRALAASRVNFTTNPKLLSTTTSGLTQAQIHSEIKTSQDTAAILAHRRNTGARSLLRRKALEKRQQIFAGKGGGGEVRASSSSGTGLPPSHVETKEEALLSERRKRRSRIFTCAFGMGGPTHEKCTERAVPLSRFCFKHITQDKFQVLYVPCNFRLGPDPDDLCSTPVQSVLEKWGCPLHALPLPEKDPPESQTRARVELEIDRVLEEPEEETPPTDEEMSQELEELVGDEVVDLEHFREATKSIYTRGLYASDSEESEDTEDDDEEEEEEHEEDGTSFKNYY